MPRPTGIPTHINLQNKMDEILLNNVDFLEQLKLQSTVIQDAVKKAIQENDISAGNVTMPILTETLATHHDSIIDFIKKNVGNISGDIPKNDMENIIHIEDDELKYVPEIQKGSNLSNPMYCYNSQFWDVPKNWSFQKNPTRRIGWEYWLKGKPGNTVEEKNEIKLAPIRPFRKFEPNRLPDKEKSVFTSSWKPIFILMEEGLKEDPILRIPKNAFEITTTFIEESFEKATNYLMKRASYIFNMKGCNVNGWKVCTWSKHVSKGYIAKFGTDEDKSYLPEGYKPITYKRKVNQAVQVQPIVLEQAAIRTAVPGLQERTTVTAPLAAPLAKKVKNSVTALAEPPLRQRRFPTARRQDSEDVFAQSFQVPTEFMVKAMEERPDDDGNDLVTPIIEDEANKQVKGQTSNPMSNDPSLHVRTDNSEGIPNASRINDANFRGAITDVIDATDCDKK